MTQEQFENAKFKSKMNVVYKGKRRRIASVDFEEKLFGLHPEEHSRETEQIEWVRCENVTSIQPI